jgi:O-antigen/teichoic acid export membrane protein
VAGAGFWSLVAIPVASEVLAALFVVALQPWRPARPRRGAGVRALVSFGVHVTASNALPLAIRRLDRVLIGGVWGTTPLGLYGRAHQLVTLPIQQLNAPVSRVAVPALARVSGDPERLRRFYLTAVRVLAWLGLPMLACVAALSREIVALVLGDAWLAAAPLLAVLAVAAAAQLVAHTAGWLLIVRGRGRPLVAWSAVSSVAHLAAYAIGLSWGALGVAVAHSVCMVALRLPHFRLALDGTAISLRDVWDATGPAAFAALAVAAATMGARAGLAEVSLEARLAAGLAVGATVWAGAIVLTPSARRAAAELIRLLRPRPLRVAAEAWVAETP